MIRSRLPYYYLLTLYFVSSFLFSQSKQIKVYTLEDGLPQSQIHAMTQDYKGYLWLGTQGGGLVRFDGKTFEVYNESNGLANNYINALIAESDTLYIGTNDGLSIKIKDEVTNIKLPQVTKIIQIDQRLFALTKRGVYKLDLDQKVQKITLPEEFKSSVINDLLFFRNVYWVATDEGLWLFDEIDNSNTKFRHIEEGLYVSLLAYENKVYASTFDDGTLVLNSNNLEDQLLIREPLRINTSTVLNNDQLWILSDNDGATIIDLDTNAEVLRLNNSNGLPVSNVKQVLQDMQSNIWLATSGGGLVKYFQNNFKHYSTQTGLKGDKVYAVHHSKGQIYISTSDKGLMRLDELGIHDVETPETISEVKIKTIATDSNENLWVGSEGKGIMFKGIISLDSVATKKAGKVNSPLLKMINVSSVWNTERGFPFDRIRDIAIVNDTIYVASYSQGIIKFTYDAQTNNLDILDTFGVSDGIVDLQINQLIVDSENRVWYGTQQGHIGFVSNDRLTHLGNVLQLNAPIHSILFWRNTLFIGTAGEGVWWSNDNEYKSFKKLQGAKSLSSENINQLIVDDQGFLWVGTERGVDKLQINNDNEVIDAFYFGRNNGFVGTETYLNAVAKDDEGHLWFGTLYGLSEYEPFESNFKDQKPKVYIEDLKVAYNSVDSIDLMSWVNSDKVWQLTPEQKQVSFTFKTIDLNHADGVSYRYKLNDNEWSPWSFNNTQEFSELNYGAHNFIVQSRNHRWIESDAIRFSFFIESPLHKKPWFITLLIGLVVIIMVVVVVQYIRRLKRKNARDKKQLELENHLLNLEQKALRLQMNPHFIFNVLNGIKAMASTKPDKMNDTVNSFASLLRETLVNSREELISLDQEIKTLKHYIEVEQLMAADGFDYDISINSNIETEEILIPPMLIQPFVENAIRHGILKGPRKGELKVQFDARQDVLKVSITDNGVGIYQSQQHKTKTDHQSMALKVTRERLESISGKSTLHIEELKQSDGSIIGTIISFELPLVTDY